MEKVQEGISSIFSNDNLTRWICIFMQRKKREWMNECSKIKDIKTRSKKCE